MKRRDFLVGAAMAGVVLQARETLAAAPSPADSLLALLGDRKAAVALGTAWLEQDTLQPEAVLATLQSRLRHQGWTGETDAQHLRGLFSAAVVDDYRAGDMVSIAGWWIAAVEAELCALACFDQAKRL